MATLYRFASVDDDDGSDKAEVACTPPGSDESVLPHSDKEALTLMEGSMYELVNMFGVHDSYADARVSREDAAQYANLLQDTINAFDAILDNSSGVCRISSHRRQHFKTIATTCIIVAGKSISDTPVQRCQMSLMATSRASTV